MLSSHPLLVGVDGADELPEEGVQLLALDVAVPVIVVVVPDLGELGGGEARELARLRVAELAQEVGSEQPARHLEGRWVRLRIWKGFAY